MLNCFVFNLFEKKTNANFKKHNRINCLIKVFCFFTNTKENVEQQDITSIAKGLYKLKYSLIAFFYKLLSISLIAHLNKLF